MPKVIRFDSGAPNRHGGHPDDVGSIKNVAGGFATYTGGGNITTDFGSRSAAGKPGTCKANYLFLDGHAETLASDLALKALFTRNW